MEGSDLGRIIASALQVVPEGRKWKQENAITHFRSTGAWIVALATMN